MRSLDRDLGRSAAPRCEREVLSRRGGGERERDWFVEMVAIESALECDDTEGDLWCGESTSLYLSLRPRAAALDLMMSEADVLYFWLARVRKKFHIAVATSTIVDS